MTTAANGCVWTIAGVLAWRLAFAAPAGTAPAGDAGPANGPDRPGKPVVVYLNDFEGAAGPEWSSRKTDLTPKGKRRFLGRLGAGTVTLTMTDLPRHQYAHLSLELFVIGGWDGRLSKRGSAEPAVWGLKIHDGPELLRATFSNDSKDGFQTYPDDVNAVSHAGCTGAAEVTTLGYKAADGSAADSVYRMRFGFAHTGKHLRLEFFASGLRKPATESWGLDNVKVELLPRPPETDLTGEKFEELWADLANTDEPIRAQHAAAELLAAGEAAVTFLDKKLVGDLKKLQRLIAELDHASWRVREKATGELRRLGPAAEPLLRRHLRQTDSLEVRVRIEGILSVRRKAPTQAEILSCIRAANLLRRLDSRRARDLAEALARRHHRMAVLRFSGTIDGSDEIAVTNERATWKHLSWQWPPVGDIELNGVKWPLDPQKQNVLANCGKTRFLIGRVDFSQAMVKMFKGRGAVRLTKGPDGVTILIDDGPQGGADLYDFEVRFFP